MRDFVPEDMTSFVIDAQSTVVLYEDISFVDL